MKDGGSCSQHVDVEINSVPVNGVIDSGANITIMGGELFRKVATVADFKKKIKKPDKTPHNYDQSPFKLDGQMDLQLTFDEKAVVTPIYMLASSYYCQRVSVVNWESFITTH